MCKSEDVQKSCHSDAQTILNAIHTGRDTDTGYYAIEGKVCLKYSSSTVLPP